MIDFAIDCPLFLRLSGFRLGTTGLYRVSVRGVEASSTEESIEDSPASAADAAVLLDFIRNAHLPFPATSKLVVEWLAKNDNVGHCFPYWFEPVVASRDATAAHSVLDEAATLLDETIEAKEQEVEALKKDSKKRETTAHLQDRLIAGHVARKKLDKMRSRREAIESIRARLPSIRSARARKAADTSHDHDRNAHEKALQLYKDGNYKNKTRAARDIAPKVHRAEPTVRKWLQGVDSTA